MFGPRTVSCSIDDPRASKAGRGRRRAGRIAALLGATLLTAGHAGAAGGPTEPAPAVKPGRVIWLEPTAPVLVPQTDAQKAAAQSEGRELPTPELLQPAVDAALPDFVPTPSLKIDRKLVVGSSDVLPSLVEGWVKGFQKYQPGFALEIVRPMAGSLGALELIKGKVDLVFVSRELKPTDVSGFRDKFGYDPFSVPISGGSWRQFGFLDTVAFMVHPDNPIRNLDFTQIDAAFSATRHRGGRAAKTWGDLGLTGEWADKPIHLYGIKPWNGFEEFIRQRVLSTDAKRGEWAEGITADPTFFVTTRRVAADRYALGYTGLSAVDSEVKILPVNMAGKAPVSPSYENVATAAYPLTRLIYLNANARSGETLDPAIREFLRFVLSKEGQTVVRDQGVYLPLRASQVAVSQAYVASK